MSHRLPSNTTSRPPLAQPPPKPLLITEHEQILDAVLRLAAAASVQVELTSDSGAARSRWTSTPLVLVGSDQAGQVASSRMPRRDGVVLVGHEPDDPDRWRHAVAIGAESVALLPADEPWLVDALADVAEGSTRGATMIGVLGGRGGAGASVLAAGLAVTAQARGHSTMLVDADPFGGGLDLLLGAEDVAGLRWPDLANTRGRLAGATLREHLPEAHGISVLSWNRGSTLSVPDEATSAVFGAAVRAWDVVIVDLPRPIDSAAEVILPRCTTTLLVVPSEVRAVAAASRVAARSCALAGDVRVVVRGPSPSGLRPAEIATSLGLPVAATLQSESGLARTLERGEPPARSGRGSLAAACDEVLDSFTRRSRRRETS
jgi:secretion/DNA translocation related CpaE-like protein